MTINEPLLKEAGEKQGAIYISSNHVELQGAYAFTKHLGVVGDIWAGYDKRYSIELMPGYYYSSPNGFCAGFYAGGGIANTTGELEVFSSGIGGMGEMKHWINDTRYTSLMWQPGVGYRFKNFEIGFASRVSYVAFSRYNTMYESWENNDSQTPIRSYSFHNDNLNMWLFQPAINLSVGLKHVKAFFSVGGNIPIHQRNPTYGHTVNNDPPGWTYYSISSGLKIDLFRKKETGK